MADTLALPWLYDQVQARFTAEGLTVPMTFGWRQPTQRLLLGNRLLWVPGDPDDGTAGVVGAARYPGRNPRPLATLPEVFTVFVLAADVLTPELERAQYIAVRTLFDAWYRAAFLAATDTLAVEDVRWLVEKKDRRYGAGLRATCTIQAMIPDAPTTDATEGLVKLAAEIATTELGVTETDTFEGDGA